MVVFLCLCCLCFCNPLWAFWQSISSRREPIYRARIYVFATHSQSVGTHLAIRQQHYRKPFAAVGADLSCPHIRIRHAFAIRWDTFGNPSAALSQTVRSCRGPIYRARVYVYPHEMGNECTFAMKWICVFDDVKTRN